MRGIGTYGLTSDFHSRYQAFPLSYDWPAARALHRNEIIEISIHDMFDEYPSLRIDRELWEPVVGSPDTPGFLVAVPITGQGRVHGVFGFITRGPIKLGVSDVHLLQGIGAALFLWLRAMNVQAGETVVDDPLTSEVPLIITPRQRIILELVESGKSNETIASVLGYSSSTVKLDLKRAMRALRVTDRLHAVTRAQELGLLDPDSASESSSAAASDMTG